MRLNDVGSTSDGTSGRAVSVRSTHVGAVVLSPDFYVGFPVGLLCGLLPVFSPTVADNTQTVLLGASAIAGALVALVLTAVAVLIGVITPAFGRLLDQTPNKLDGLMRPFWWVIGIAAVSCSTGLMAALAWPWAQSMPAMRFICVGIPFGTLMWSLAGCVQAIGLTIRTVNQSRRYADLQERAAQLRRVGNS